MLKETTNGEQGKIEWKISSLRNYKKEAMFQQRKRHHLQHRTMIHSVHNRSLNISRGSQNDSATAPKRAPPLIEVFMHFPVWSNDHLDSSTTYYLPQRIAALRENRPAHVNIM